MSVISTATIRDLPVADLPWSRARATRGWVKAFGALAVLRIAILVSLPAFTAVALRDLGDDVARAVLFPALFLAIVLFAERRFLRRPPKGILAAQLAFFCAGAMLHGFALVSSPAMALAGTLVLSGSTVLLGTWFLGVLLVPLD